MSLFVNLFLAAFALDAALSLADELASRLWGVSGLAPLRAGVAAGVVLFSLAIWLAAIGTPRLPKRVALPPAAFALWCSLGGAPLGLLVASDATRTLLASGAQALLAVGAFAVVRRRYGAWWLSRRALASRPAFRPLYTLGALGLHLLLAPPLLAGYVALLVAESLTRSTDRFVSFGAPGLLLEERRYRRGDREVVLVGMMHVADPELYREVYASFVRDSTLVLQEGVTDEQGLIRVRLSYEPLAEAIGLGAQPGLAEVLDELQADGEGEAPGWPHLRHADLDAAALSPETLRFVEQVAGIVGAGDPASALRAFAAYLRGLDAQTLRAVTDDVITRRNAHVLGELEGALAEYRTVVIPWGALHMPGIQEALLERGFERVDARRRLAADYATLGNGVWRALRAVGGSAGAVGGSDGAGATP